MADVEADRAAPQTPTSAPTADRIDPSQPEAPPEGEGAAEPEGLTPSDRLLVASLVAAESSPEKKKRSRAVGEKRGGDSDDAAGPETFPTCEPPSAVSSGGGESHNDDLLSSLRLGGGRGRAHRPGLPQRSSGVGGEVGSPPSSASQPDRGTGRSPVHVRLSPADDPTATAEAVPGAHRVNGLDALGNAPSVESDEDDVELPVGAEEPPAAIHGGREGAADPVLADEGEAGASVWEEEPRLPGAVAVPGPGFAAHEGGDEACYGDGDGNNGDAATGGEEPIVVPTATLVVEGGGNDYAGRRPEEEPLPSADVVVPDRWSVVLMGRRVSLVACAALLVVVLAATVAATVLATATPPRRGETPSPTGIPTAPASEAAAPPSSTIDPAEMPSRPPTRRPTLSPTEAPTEQPARRPTLSPTETPTRQPTQRPTPTFVEKSKLVAAGDDAAGDRFGRSVAIDGDTAAAGAYGDDGNRGSVHVYARRNETWRFEDTLVAGDGAAGDGFGYSVSISGQTLVVGAWTDDHGGRSSAGAAYVFVRVDGAWSQEDRLVAGDAASGDLFGCSVAISGDSIVVGGRYDDNEGGVGAGAAYVFVRSDGAWSQEDKLVAGDGAAFDWFGSSVAIREDAVVVGAWKDDNEGGVNAGAVYVFVRSDGTWFEEAKIVAGDGADNFWFGHSVEIDGNTIVAGMGGDCTLCGGSSPGGAYVFVRSGDGWSQEDELLAGDGAADDSFGYSVAISGNAAIVGAYRNSNERGHDAGAAYVFVQSDGTWSQVAQLLAEDGGDSDYFGRSVAISNHTVVVGADGDGNGGVNAGAAYIFEPN